MGHVETRAGIVIAVSGRAVVRAGAGLAGVLSIHTILNTRFLRRAPTSPEPCRERVALCVPARNEVAAIGACVASLLASTGVGELRIVVLDDGSTDGTGNVARQLASAVLPGSISLSVIDGGEEALPHGWLGKPWACERLRRSVTDADVIVFVDADVRLEPLAVSRAVALLRSTNLDLVSPYPRQLAVSFGERLVQPLLQWLWLTLLPLRLAERTRPNSMAAANGQFLVMDAGALAAVGGFAAVRGDVLDDVALVRAFKRAGRRGTVVDGTTLATCRMYTDWSLLRDGYTKNLWAGTGSPLGAAGLSSILALAYIVPALGAVGLFGQRARLWGLLGYFGGVLGRVVSARTTGGNVVDSAAHPASVMVLIGLIGRSWRDHRAGTIVWKGRPVG